MDPQGGRGQARPSRPWHGPWTADRTVAASGTILAIGGAVIGLAAVAHPDARHPPSAAELAAASYAFWHVVSAVGFACLAAGIGGVIAVQVRATGAVGFIDVVGYLLVILGTIGHAGLQFIDGLALGAVATVLPIMFDLNGELYGAPFLAGPAAFAGTSLAAGLVAIGVGAIRRRVVPVRPLVSLMIGGILVGLPVQPASPIPWWFVTAGGLAIAAGCIATGRWISLGGMTKSRLPPLPRTRLP